MESVLTSDACTFANPSRRMALAGMSATALAWPAVGHVLQIDRSGAGGLDPSSGLEASELARRLVASVDLSADGAMWTGKATMMLNGVMVALVILRDQGLVRLTPETVAAHLELGRIVDMADGRHHPSLPNDARFLLGTYLRSLPAYDPSLGHAQPEVAMRVHGHLRERIALSLAELPRHRSIRLA
jgi:hypothetical protein